MIFGNMEAAPRSNVTEYLRVTGRRLASSTEHGPAFSHTMHVSAITALALRSISLHSQDNLSGKWPTRPSPGSPADPSTEGRIWGPDIIPRQFRPCQCLYSNPTYPFGHVQIPHAYLQSEDERGCLSLRHQLRGPFGPVTLQFLTFLKTPTVRSMPEYARSQDAGGGNYLDHLLKWRMNHNDSRETNI